MELPLPPVQQSPQAKTLLLGDSKIKDERCKRTIRHCLAGTMVGMTEKLPGILPKHPTIDKIILHTGTNDISKNNLSSPTHHRLDLCLRLDLVIPDKRFGAQIKHFYFASFCFDYLLLTFSFLFFIFSVFLLCFYFYLQHIAWQFCMECAIQIKVLHAWESVHL